MCALVLLLGSNVVFAQEQPYFTGPAPAPAPAPTGTVQERLTELEKTSDAESIWKTMGFRLGGGVSIVYNHNFNQPNTNLSQLHTETAQTNTFTTRMTQLLLERTAANEGSTANRVGFRSRINIGPDGRVSRARTNYLPGTDNTELDIQELYAQYIAPIGNGLEITFGRHSTDLGNETFTSWMNPNLTRTFNYNLAQAFTDTGLRLVYAFNPNVKLMAELINGWDNVDDNNFGKVYAGALTLTNFDGRLTNYFYSSWGPEQSNGRGGAGVNGAGGLLTSPGNATFCNSAASPVGSPGCDPNAKRLELDYIGTAKVTDMDTIILEVHYGNESNASFSRANARQSPNARWDAVILYLNHDFNDQWSLRLRNEFFEDAGGARTCSGAVNFNAGNNTCAPSIAQTGTPQTLYSSTNTLEYRLTPNLITRTEFRYDKSNKASFLRVDREVNNQSTMYFNVVYLF